MAIKFAKQEDGSIMMSFKPEDLGYTKEELEEEAAVFCDCEEPDEEPVYKKDGVDHLGVTKHGWICRKCNKFVQIG